MPHEPLNTSSFIDLQIVLITHQLKDIGTFIEKLKKLGTNADLLTDYQIERFDELTRRVRGAIRVRPGQNP